MKRFTVPFNEITEVGVDVLCLLFVLEDGQPGQPQRQNAVQRNTRVYVLADLGHCRNGVLCGVDALVVSLGIWLLDRQGQHRESICGGRASS